GEGGVAGGRIVLQERRALLADHLVQHAAEGVGRKESAVRHAARERDDGAARRDRRYRAGSLVVGTDDLRAAREEAGPVERDGGRDGWGRDPRPPRRAPGDEGALPPLRPRPPGPHPLLAPHP